MLLVALAVAVAHAGVAGATTATLSIAGGLGRVRVHAEPGEHVNAEAPARLSNGREELSGLGDLRWARLPVADGQQVTLDVGVCDDDGSDCRLVSLSVTLDLARGRYTLQEAPPPPPVARPAGAAVRLYDFTAIWCPPCQRLAAEVLHDPADADRLSQYEIVAIDADQPASWPLKTRYRVTGYPTLLAVDAEGNEVDRYLGFESETDFWAWLGALDGRPALAGLAGGPPPGVTGEEAAAAALRFYRADRAGEAEAWMAVATGDSVAMHHARLYDERVDARADVDWMARHAEPGDWLYLAVDRYPELFPGLAPLVAALDPGTAAACLDRYAAFVEADSADSALAARAGALALLRATLGDEPARNKGRVVEIADLHASLGQLPAALAMLDEYRVIYPAEFTWDFTAARLWLDAGRLAEAEARARAALDLATGDQVLRAAERLARVLVAAGKRSEALVLVKATLAAAPRPDATMVVRTDRYLAALEGLRGELE